MANEGVLRVAIVGDHGPLQKSLNKAGAAVKSFGQNLAKLGLAAGAAAGAALVKGTVDALNLEQIEDKLAAQLNLTEEQAAASGEVAGRLYADAYGGSLEEVGQAVGNVQAAFDEATDPGRLEKLSQKALDVAEAFDVDVQQAVNAASVAVESGLAGDATHAFDLIVASMQKVPAEMRGELIPIVEEYSESFANLGLGGEDAFGLMVQAAKSGRFELDKVGDALKELTIRGTDMSTSSVEAFEKAGLSADDMAGRFLEGGDSAKGALDDLVDGLLAMEDPTERANAAIALFGTPLEDMSTSEIPEFLQSLDSMSGSLGQVDEAAEMMGNTLNDNLSTRLEAIKRKGFMALAAIAETVVVPALEKLVTFSETTLVPAFNRIVEWWQANGPAIIATVQQVAGQIRAGFDVIVAAVQTVASWIGAVFGSGGEGSSKLQSFAATVSAWATQIGAIFSSAWAAIKAVTSTALSILREFWDRFGAHILKFAKTTWNNIKQIIGGVLKAIQGLFEVFAGVFTGDWSRAWDGVKQYFSGIWEAILGIFKQQWNLLSTAIGAGLAAISQLWSEIWERIKGVLSAAWEFMKDATKASMRAVLAVMTGGLSEATAAVVQNWDDIMDTTERVWNGVKQFISGALDTVVGFITAMPGRVSAAASGMWDGIKDAFRSAINWIISAWNRLEFRIPGFDPPGPGPRFHGFTLGVPNIPLLADGGVLTEPTLFVGGETARSRPEIVTPERLLRSIVRDELERTRDQQVIINVQGDVHRPLDEDRIATLIRRAEMLHG